MNKTSIILSFTLLFGCADNTQIANYEDEENLPPSKPLKCISAISIQSNNSAAYIAAAAKACAEESNFDQGAELMMVAIAYAHFDTLRVKDKTAHGALNVLQSGVYGALPAPKGEKLFDSVDALEYSSSKRQEVCNFLRSSEPPTYMPIYMIAHGIEAAKGSSKDALVKEFNSIESWNSAMAFVNCGSSFAQIQPEISSGIESSEDLIYYIHFRQANKYYKASQFSLAIESYSKTIDLNSEFRPAYDQRAKAYLLNDQHELAIKDLSYLIQVEPNNPYYHYHLGMTLFNTGRIDDAIIRMTKVIEIDPSYDDAYGMRGFFYSKLDRIDLTCADFIAACDHGNCGALSDVPRMCLQYVTFRDIPDEDKTEYVPVLRIQPDYPSEACNKGIEGYALVGFVVSKAGRPAELEILDTNLPDIFNQSIYDAMNLWQFTPRMVNGKAVTAPGLSNKIFFSADQCEGSK